MTTMSFGKPDSMPALTRYDGVDSRPTLLRVLTDLYVQKPAHSAEEERYYTELALRLVEVVDLATRKTVADRLVRYPAAPLAVIQRLAHDIFEFAKLDLGRASAAVRAVEATQEVVRLPPPSRDRTTMDSLETTEPAPAPQAAAASSAPVPGTLTARLFADREPAGSHEPVTAEEPQHLSSPSHSSGAHLEVDAPTRSEPPSADRQLGEQFYTLDAPARRLMLLRLSVAADRPSAAIKPNVGVCARLETAALGGQPDVFIGELERALDLSRTEAQRIVNDTLGEPVVVAGKALAMPLDMLQRILLFLNPAVGRSVERLYALTALYQELRPEAALRLVLAWRGPATPQTRSGRHQPLHFDDERRGARDSATPMPRRSATPNAATERPPGPYSVGYRHRTS